jgi:hypothetical protein
VVDFIFFQHMDIIWSATSSSKSPLNFLLETKGKESQLNNYTTSDIISFQMSIIHKNVPLMGKFEKGSLNLAKHAIECS